MQGIQLQLFGNHQSMKTKIGAQAVFFNTIKHKPHMILNAPSTFTEMLTHQ